MGNQNGCYLLLCRIKKADVLSQGTLTPGHRSMDLCQELVDEFKGILSLEI